MTTEPFTLTLFGHACVRLEKAGQRLVLDPGGYSDMRALESADAILVTHDHPDHWQAEPIVERLAEDTEAVVWAPEGVAKQLVQAGAPRDRVNVAEDGVALDAVGFSVTPTVTDHAQIHPEIPLIPNTGYLIEGVLLHPGDALTVAPENLEILLLPLTGPWSKASETIDYAHKVRAQRVIPIHDAILSEIGQGLYDGLVGGMLPEGSEFERLARGVAIEID